MTARVPSPMLDLTGVATPPVAVAFSAGPDYTSSATLTIQIATSGSDTIIGTGTVYVYVENAYGA